AVSRFSRAAVGCQRPLAAVAGLASTCEVAGPLVGPLLSLLGREARPQGTRLVGRHALTEHDTGRAAGVAAAGRLLLSAASAALAALVVAAGTGVGAVTGGVGVAAVTLAGVGLRRRVRVAGRGAAGGAALVGTLGTLGGLLLAGVGLCALVALAAGVGALGTL